jgi:Domain of unknown function (DUF222)
MGWQSGRDDGTGAEPGPDPGPAGSGDAPGGTPRDGGLAGFARNGEWDTCPPAAILAVALEAASGQEWRCPGATRDEMFGLLRRWAALESWAMAGKLGVLRALIREEGQPLPGGGYHGDLPDGWSKSLTHEVSLALVMPPQSAESLMQTAWDLQAVLPGIGALLADGTLTYAKARAVGDALAVLTDGDRAKAEAMILPLLAGRTYGQAEKLAVEAAITVDPRSATRRREDAERNRARVTLRRDPSGAASLAGYDLPPDEALAAHANVCARAAQYKDSDVFPGVRMDQFRAMAYVDILNGITAEARIACGQPPAGLGAPNEYGPDGHAPDPDDDCGPDSEAAGPDDTVGPATRAWAADPEPGTADPDRNIADQDQDGAATRSGHRPRTSDEAKDHGGRENGPDDEDRDGGTPGGDDPEDPGPGGGPGGKDMGGGPDHGQGGTGGKDHDGGSAHGPVNPAGSATGHGGPTGCSDDLILPDRPGCSLGSRGPAGDDTGGTSPGGSGLRPPSGLRPQGGSPPEAAVAPPRLADLVLPLSTLLGLAERPGEGHGLGPLDPDLCRALAATAATSRYSTLCVTVTDIDGIAIGHGCARPARRNRPGPGRASPGQASRAAVDPVHGPPRVLAALPARVNLTVTADRLAALTQAADRRSSNSPETAQSPETVRSPDNSSRPQGPGLPGYRAPGPWSFNRTADPGPPGGYGTWVLTPPGGSPLTVKLEPVPTLRCDHRHESHAYQPNDTLRHLVQVRDCECTFPTCSRHARESDFEHAIPYDKGGRTCGCNAGARSRQCHRVKQSKGWKVTQPRPGWHQWETPSGRCYTQSPKRYLV